MHSRNHKGRSVATTSITSIALIAWLGVVNPAAAQNRCFVEGTTLPANYAHFADAFPAGDSSMVPLDGFIRLRYYGRVPEGPLFVEAVSTSGSAVTIAGQVNVVDAATPNDFAEIHFQSAEAFQPLSRYRVTFPDITGGAASNRFEFTTGSVQCGTTPPAFEGLRGDPTVVTNGETDQCGDPHAMTVSLHWTRASSAWPMGDLEYIVYQTRGAGIGGPVERARQRGRLVNNDLCAQSASGSSADGQCMSFRLTSANASQPMCFNVQALDAFGRTDGNREEKCVDPDVGASFVGCTAAPGGPQHKPLGWLLIAASVTVAAVGVSRLIGRRKR